MLKLRTEEEIIASWKGSLDRPLVSILCITYNHEKYIEDAIKGFLIQETDFPYEIIIHDDASTDRTQEIIREYCNSYPRLIRPIIQEVNQYSRGAVPFYDFLHPAAKGEYLAICEGDDYWCSKEKLKKQFKALNETQFQVAFNLSKILDEQSKQFKINVNPATKLCDEEIVIYEFSDVANGGASLMRTGSLFLRKNCIDGLPAELRNTPAPDIFLQLFCALDGAVCINLIMTVYRTNIANSWSSRNIYDIEVFRRVTREMLVGCDFFCNFLLKSKPQVRNISKIRYRFIYQYYRLKVGGVFERILMEQVSFGLKKSDYIKSFFWAIFHHVSKVCWRLRVKAVDSVVKEI